MWLICCFGLFGVDVEFVVGFVDDMEVCVVVCGDLGFQFVVQQVFVVESVVLGIDVDIDYMFVCWYLEVGFFVDVDVCGDLVVDKECYVVVVVQVVIVVVDFQLVVIVYWLLVVEQVFGGDCLGFFGGN